MMQLQFSLGTNEITEYETMTHTHTKTSLIINFINLFLNMVLPLTSLCL